MKKSAKRLTKPVSVRDDDTSRLHRVYAFYDSKAESFGPSPMVFPTPGLAVRAIEKGCNSEGTGFFENPADYTFFEIGTYNPENAEIAMYESKREIGTALQYKRSQDVSPN